MEMQEIARMIIGLRTVGWDEKYINDFILYVESGDEKYLPKSNKSDNK